MNFVNMLSAQSGRAVEYVNCIFAEERDHLQMSVLDHSMMRLQS